MPAPAKPFSMARSHNQKQRSKLNQAAQPDAPGLLKLPADLATPRRRKMSRSGQPHQA